MVLEGLYREIVESSADGIWVFDLAGRTLYANPALAEMFGVSQEEFCRLTVFDSLDEVGREQFREHLVDLAEGRFNSGDAECRFVRSDGSSIWVLVGERGLYNADGELEGILHRLSDYSDRRQTLDELTTSQRQLAEAQRIARIGSWEWDVAADQITGSAGLYALYGLSPDDFPASYADFVEIVHEDDRAEVDEAVQGARRSGGEFVFEARVQGEDDWVWTRGRGVAQTNAEGLVVSMSGTHQDITEAKLAELALQDQVAQNNLMQLIASAANEARTLDEVLTQARGLVLLHDDWERGRGFAVVDGDVEPFYINPGDREADEATADISAMELALARRCLGEMKPVWDDKRLTIAFPIVYAGEAHAIITITSAPPLYRHEMIQTMVEQVALQLGQVVERELHERQLADARDGAMEASRQKSEFLATMSHEIRTPLNGVIGLNDLLLRTQLDAEQRRLATGAQAAGRTLLGLINDILDFSKIEAGKLELEEVDFEVRPVFDQVTNLLAEPARDKGLSLMVSCDASVPEVLSGDPTRLVQVIANLGSNAVKFTETGEVRIRATCEEADGRTQMRVEVSDTGIGVAGVNLDQLFDSFTQADTSTTRVHGGTGLGLAISRELVHALRGEIGVDSAEGRGSVFWFTATFEPPTGSAKSLDDEHARTWLASRRVLVVDGNEHHSEVLAAQLGRWQVRSHVVTSGPDAEQALAHAVGEGDPFALVLVDRALPEAGDGGLELARLIRATPAHDEVALLLMTATTDLDTAGVRESGVADVLTKPILNHTLRGALLEHLAGVDARVVDDEQVDVVAGKRPRILVVEDNLVNQMVAVGLLEALGYDADTAEDGVVALETYRPGAYDAVLMDVQMPRLDGYAATRAIRERETGTRVPILAMTAAAIEGERERCLAAGMDDFLTKPVDPDALAATLRQWLPAPADVTESRSPAASDSRSLDGDGLDEERLDMLRDMSPGDTSYLDRAIGNFVTRSPGEVEQIRTAVAAGDLATVRQVAHKLAGGASNLGAQRVADAARALELAADAGGVSDLDVLESVLSAALVRDSEALRGYQASYAAESRAVGG